VSSWLPPLRSPGPAGPMIDTFLDATHGPFVHASTIGAADSTDVAPSRVEHEPGGFTSVQEQWCDNPVDPEVALGGRPLRQRRRTTYVYRAPFQLRLRQEFLDSGATTTIVYLLQPEDLDSSRLYVCLLLSNGPGQPLPTPSTAAAQIALQQGRSSRRTSAPRPPWTWPGCRWTGGTRCTSRPTGAPWPSGRSCATSRR
jgi:phenylpropionate dioxygenase-like ring-hydroxylating dioxygenase large terminal subunit